MMATKKWQQHANINTLITLRHPDLCNVINTTTHQQLDGRAPSAEWVQTDKLYKSTRSLTSGLGLQGKRKQGEITKKIKWLIWYFIFK